MLAGGGARGAYEIGVLSALLPALEQDEQPQIVIGTSVGAINAAHLAAHAHESARQIADGGIELWKQIGYGSVLKPLVSLSEGERLWSYMREVLGSRRAHTNSLLDPTPLTGSKGTRGEYGDPQQSRLGGHLEEHADSPARAFVGDWGR